MSELNTSTTTDAILEKYRDSSLFLLKLDIGLLIVISTAVTILNLQRVEILESILEAKFVLISIVILIIIGIWIGNYITQRIHRINQNANYLKRARILISVQSYSNIFLLIIFSYFTLSSVNKYLLYTNQNEMMENFNSAITSYLNEHKRLPNELSDIMESNPHLALKFDVDQIDYQIIQNPYKNDDKLRAFSNKVLELFLDELRINGISINDSVSNYNLLINKYPGEWNEIKNARVEFQLFYYYLLRSSGYDLSLYTEDDFITHCSNTITLDKQIK